MEADDYKTLLKQAEEELGKTPGAYCSRKVAVRAMELLQAHNQAQLDELEEKKKTAAEAYQIGKNSYEQTIQRQAEAIKRLEAEKTKGLTLKSATTKEQNYFLQKERDRFGMNPSNPYESGLLEKELQRRQEAERIRFRDDRNPFGQRINEWLDKTGPAFKDPLK